MKYSGAVALMLGLTVVPLCGQDASVTLFNSGRMLVRRTLPLTIPAGTSTQTLPLGLFDPQSLTSLDAGVSFARIAFDPANSEEALLRRMVGKTLTYLRAGSTESVNATLLALDPERWRLMDGSVIFGRPGQIRWPQDLVPRAAVADVQLQSDRARSSLRMMYQSSGAGWAAQYRIFVGAGARVEGSAMLQSGRLDLANAEVQLLAGDIGAPPNSLADNAVAMEARAFSAMKAAPMPSEEAIGEVHLYTLADKVTFVPGTQTVVPLFLPTAASAERRYTVSGGLSYYGGMGPEAEEQPVPVAVTWRLDRKAGTPFGDLPLPGGGVAVFDVDKGGRPQLIGQGSIGHTAAGEALTVATGTAFDVTAKRTQTEFATVRNANGRTIATMAFTVVLTNAKDSVATVEVQERRGGEWSVLTSSVPAQKRAASLTAFVVNVPAKGSTTLTYRLRVVW